MKTKKIYNFRIEMVDNEYIPQFNHERYGWVNIKTDETLESDDIVLKYIFLDISNKYQFIKIYKKNIAIAIINKYKDINNLDFIKKEYIYID